MSETILAAMQFEFLNDKAPLNTADLPARVITYDFATDSAPADFTTDFTSIEDSDAAALSGWTAFSAAEKDAVRLQMDHIESVLNISFTEAPGAADPDLNLGKITIEGELTGLGGTSISSSGQTVTRWDGFAFFDNTIDLADPREANLILHEISHALGAKHPFEDGTTLPQETENNKFTVMSYANNPDSDMLASTLMLYDLLALQDIWGSTELNPDDTVYSGSTSGELEVVWDTGGRDTFSADTRSTATQIDLREGRFSSFDSTDDIVIAFGTRIENATGSSAGDVLGGNVGANKLSGNQGADTLTGLAGADKLNGGKGKDILNGNKGADTLNGGKGDDVLSGHGGGDRFVYKGQSGDDVIEDFRNNKDEVLIRGHGDLNAVLASADEVDGDVVFHFSNTDSLTVRDTTLLAISDDILI